MFDRTLMIDPAQRAARTRRLAAQALCLFMLLWAARSNATQPALWFPDAPTFAQYDWSDTPCTGCVALDVHPDWRRMAELAGVPAVRFRLAPDESQVPAYSVAPDIVVLSRTALALEPCQLAFLVGHEIVHIAQRHFDEDAIALSVLSGKPARWTTRGGEALQLTDGDFGLALRAAHLWQAQEAEADWLGTLLAAACGCDVEAGALAWFRQDDAAGGGLAAAHSTHHERAQQIKAYADMARRLSARTRD
jgi:Zn-dependent protease with chaperone function